MSSNNELNTCEIKLDPSNIEVDFEETITLHSGDLLTRDKNSSFRDFHVEESGVYYIADENLLTNSYTISISRPGEQLPQICPAGISIGKDEETGKEIGEYIYYNPSTQEISTGDQDIGANCYYLLSGCNYRINNTTMGEGNFKFINLTNYEALENPVEIINENITTYTAQSITAGYTGVKAAYILKKDTGLFETIESILAGCIRSLANGLNYLVQFSLKNISGTEDGLVTIDSLIFNEYPDTSISFFKNSMVQKTPSKIIEMFRDTIQKWYKVFQLIAIAGYIVILLYVGVKILLAVGTKKQSKFKELLLYWLYGIIILGFFPYAMKLIIDVNDLFVEILKESSQMELIQQSNSKVDLEGFEMPSSYDEEEINKYINKIDKCPYKKTDGGYMAYMALKAEKSDKIIDAIVYLIMVWQFIMIIIFYYKRLFMISFLIVIFPFVCFSYALDKLADGKAQAFDTWTKEFVTNVFAQSIHAVIYSFVIGATFASGKYSGDWLLTIVGITFLFKGEEILKKIIGQEAETSKSLAQTAVRTVAAVTATKKVVESVADNVVGASSHLGRTVSYGMQSMRMNKMARMAERQNPSSNNRSNSPTNTPPPVQLFNNSSDDLQNAIDILNSNEDIDPTIYTEALNKVMQNQNSLDPDVQRIMGTLDFSKLQLKGIDIAQTELISDILDLENYPPEEQEMRKEIIDKNLELKLREVFPDERDVQKVKQAIYINVKNSNNIKLIKHRTRELTEEAIEKEYNEANSDRDKILDLQKFRSGEIGFRKLKAKNPKNPHAGEKAKPKYANNFEKNIGIIKSVNSNSRIYSQKEVWSAINDLGKKRNYSDEEKRIYKANFGDAKVSDIKAVFARAILEENSVRGVNFNKGNLTDEEVRNQLLMVRGKNIDDQIESTYLEAYRYNQEVIESKLEGTGGSTLDALNKITVTDTILHQDTTETDNEYFEKIAIARKLKNEDEVRTVENFAMDMIERTLENQGDEEPTFEGLTAHEYEEYAKSLKKQFWEELIKTGATTTGVMIGGFAGAAANIGLNDEKSILEEGAIGALAGVAAGDKFAETLTGDDSKGKEIRVENPYTGEIQKIRVRTTGINGDPRILKIGKDEVVRMDDPRLKGVKAKVDEKMYEAAQEKRKQENLQRRKDLFINNLH